MKHGALNHAPPMYSRAERRRLIGFLTLLVVSAAVILGSLFFGITLIEVPHGH